VGDQPGLSRRQLIKASAVAGAAAWTAPAIIDSLASPAAAASTCSTWYRAIANENNVWGQGNNGFCGHLDSFDGHTLVAAPPALNPILLCGSGDDAGMCSVTLPAGCGGQLLLVQVHYGGGGVDGTCVTAECMTFPLSDCGGPVPPTTGCACKSGNTLSFPQKGRSGVQVVFCC
jgi:hypothetical protein